MRHAALVSSVVRARRAPVCELPGVVKHLPGEAAHGRACQPPLTTVETMLGQRAARRRFEGRAAYDP